jgi:hypothetical protein
MIVEGVDTSRYANISAFEHDNASICCFDYFNSSEIMQFHYVPREPASWMPSNHEFLATFRSEFSLAPQSTVVLLVTNVMPDCGDRYRLLTRPHDDHYITAFTTLDSAFVWRRFWAKEDHPTLRKDRLIQGSGQRIKGILLQLVLRSRGLVWNDKWKRGILVVAIRPNISDSLLTSSIITNIMLKSTLLAALSAVVTSAELLDIPGLLASLAPAPEGDSRFTTFTPPGHNDGEPASISSIQMVKAY